MMELYIVTGCTSGLGLALHNQLVKEDKNIQCVFLGRGIQRIEPSPQHKYVEFDFSCGVAPNLDTQLNSHNFSRITLISNAGTIDPIGNTASLDVDLFQRSVSINFIAPALLAVSLSSLSLKNNIYLRVVNVSSGAALRPIRGWAAYCSTKASVRMFFDVMALENDNVEVIHIDPGVMDTAMQEGIRKSCPLDMPDVGSFLNFKRDQKLKSVIDVAKSILDELKVES